MGRGRDANREEFWRQAVQRRADSGLTIEEFCAREDLKPTTYQYWQKAIRHRDDQRPLRPTKLDAEPTLAAVQLVDDQSGAATVEIVVQNGYVVRVGQQATSDQVRRVLQVVRELD